jgi:hypothetical protein
MADLSKPMAFIESRIFRVEEEEMKGVWRNMCND